MTLTAKVGKGGTKAKPKPVKARFTADISGPAGLRADAPTRLSFSWSGVVADSRFSETCTTGEIDAAQSDAGCPSGSLIGSGTFTALMGPEIDKSSSAPCVRTAKLYNAGGDNVAIFSTGAPEDCLGITYLSPVAARWARKGKTSTLVIDIPDNIQHPLPGLVGFFQKLDIRFSKHIVSHAGKSYAYLQSLGCGKKARRTFTFTAFTAPNPQGVATKTDAGAC